MYKSVEMFKRLKPKYVSTDVPVVRKRKLEKFPERQCSRPQPFCEPGNNDSL